MKRAIHKEGASQPSEPSYQGEGSGMSLDDVWEMLRDPEEVLLFSTEEVLPKGSTGMRGYLYSASGSGNREPVLWEKVLYNLDDVEGSSSQNSVTYE